MRLAKGQSGEGSGPVFGCPDAALQMTLRGERRHGDKVCRGRSKGVTDMPMRIVFPVDGQAGSVAEMTSPGRYQGACEGLKVPGFGRCFCLAISFHGAMPRGTGRGLFAEHGRPSS